MTTHTDLLNFIAARIKAKTYLDIGVYNPDHNFNKINVAKKISVDPDPKAGAIICATSDTFFDLMPDNKFDLIFIDGLHHADQVKKDIVNAWRCLNPGGAIVLHDCNPPTENTTCVPRGAQREWCGDVYKLATAIGSYKITVDFDYGCMVLHKTAATLELEFTAEPINWEDFAAHREEYLQLVTIDAAKTIIATW